MTENEKTANVQAEVEQQDVDLAAATLERLKRASSTNPTQGTSSSKRTRSTSSTPANTPGSGSDERDPKLLGDAVDRLIAERGWSTQAAGGDLIANWSQIVGEDLASHVGVERIDGTVLTLRAESTTWMNAAKLYATTIQNAVDTAVGAGVITEIKIVGPAAPSWVKGPRTVKGRGPRDTYG